MYGTLHSDAASLRDSSADGLVAKGVHLCTICVVGVLVHPLCHVAHLDRIALFMTACCWLHLEVTLQSTTHFPFQDEPETTFPASLLVIPLAVQGLGRIL